MFSCTQELPGNDLEQTEIGKEREESLTVFVSKDHWMQIAKILVLV